MPTWIYPVIIAANIPVYYGLYRLLFRDSDELFDAIIYWFTPGMWSWFDGELRDDMWAEFKLGVYLAVCSGCVYLELQALAPLWSS